MLESRSIQYKLMGVTTSSVYKWILGKHISNQLNCKRRKWCSLLLTLCHLIALHVSY